MLDVGTSVEVFAGDHAVIHRDVPVISNACYLIGGRLLHPGDSLTVLDRPVEILALPDLGAVDGRQGGRSNTSARSIPRSPSRSTRR